jgi:hypothetical protein
MKTHIGRRGSWLVAVAAVGLIALAACDPAKDTVGFRPPPTPPPPTTVELPPPGVCPAGTQACLSINPESWIYQQNHEVRTFTVLNSGPGTTQPLNTVTLYRTDPLSCSSARTTANSSSSGPASRAR